MIKEISKCRVCGNTNLIEIIDLGIQSLTGVFPKDIGQKVTSGPLKLVKCQYQNSEDICGLVQLKHSYEISEMYGDNYGYRTGLNKTMVKHINDIVTKILKTIKLETGDLVIDIGSNDGTLLKLYPDHGYLLCGIDPTAKKFHEFYTDTITVITDFFSGTNIKRCFGNKRAKIITSIAMFYDLENPLDFIKQIYEVLDDQGIWVLEQSYLPTILKNTAYDTICQEHLEYYGLKQIKWMLDRTGFKIIDIEFNDTNGGSFCLFVAKTKSNFKECSDKISHVLAEEDNLALNTIEPFNNFSANIKRHKEKLIKILHELNSQGKKVFGYGASTKGNVVIQYCGITSKDIPYILDVNEDKFGSYTPNSFIPIISEVKGKAMKPDYLLVFPWHFRDYFVNKESEFLKNGGHLIFPIPTIEIL